MTDRVIVADSSPLIALAVTGAIDLLPQLYRGVLLPPAVWDEVTIAGQGLPGAEVVRGAGWLKVTKPDPAVVAALTILVGQGEAEAIALAQSVVGSILLLDDAQARRVAERIGLRRIGTLGILRKAKIAGLLDRIEPLIDQLAHHGIYMSRNLIDAILRDVGERI